jgi:hypothetical protein
VIDVWFVNSKNISATAVLQNRNDGDRHQNQG